MFVTGAGIGQPVIIPAAIRHEKLCQTCSTCACPDVLISNISFLHGLPCYLENARTSPIHISSIQFQVQMRPPMRPTQNNKEPSEKPDPSLRRRLATLLPLAMSVHLVCKSLVLNIKGQIFQYIANDMALRVGNYTAATPCIRAWSATRRRYSSAPLFPTRS